MTALLQKYMLTLPFSACEYRFSVSISVLDANPIDFSEQFVYLWDNTAQIPCDEAS